MTGKEKRKSRLLSMGNSKASKATHVRFKVGVVEILDVEQQFRPDVNIFFYYKPTFAVHVDQRDGCRFENIEQPDWVPHFDFENEVDEHLTTDESYWYDLETGLIFGRINVLPKLQERFDHSAFPFDRQVLDIKLLSNNTNFLRWEKKSGEFPPELLLKNDSWQVQAELAALADSWDLHDVRCNIINDRNAHSTMVNFQILIERCSSFYVWNIGFVYFLIILAQACLFVFPYNETRFDFSMQLALTTVAFKFVTQTQVPKTTYMNSMERYILLGLVLLAFRFLGDTVIQIGFERPIGEEGYRGECVYFEELNGCTVDIFLTGGLAGIWILYTIMYLMFGRVYLKASWKSLQRESSRTVYKLKGKSNMLVENRSFNYDDMAQSTMNLKVIEDADTKQVSPSSPSDMI